jgi:hypothetical protein
MYSPYVRPSILRFFVCMQICGSPYRIKPAAGCRRAVCVPVEMHAAAAGCQGVVVGCTALLHLHVPGYVLCLYMVLYVLYELGI